MQDTNPFFTSIRRIVPSLIPACSATASITNAKGSHFDNFFHHRLYRQCQKMKGQRTQPTSKQCANGGGKKRGPWAARLQAIPWSQAACSFRRPAGPKQLHGRRFTVCRSRPFQKNTAATNFEIPATSHQETCRDPGVITHLRACGRQVK